MSDPEATPSTAASTRLTRGAFLRGCGALGAASVPLAAQLARPGTAAAQRATDTEALNALLRLEYVLVAFYEEAIDRLDLRPELRRLAEATSDDDQSHVRGLKNLIRDFGGSAAEQPGAAFDSLDDVEGFLSTAVELKDLSVSAYAGALRGGQPRVVFGSLASTMQVDGRHAAHMRLAADLPPAPSAFGEALTMEAVRRRLERFVA